jgi:hypothetical protein
VRSIWRGSTERGNEALLGNTFGREGTLCPRWAATREVIRRYIQQQEAEDRRLDQLNLNL